MTTHEITLKALEYLQVEFKDTEWIKDSAIFNLFIEAVDISRTKTELKKNFTTYCNEELGRAYLIGDAIYIELKDFIRSTKIKIDTHIIIKACEYNPKKMHIYNVKTKGNHPVRLIYGGDYITESTVEINPTYDLGWFYLNQKEYDYFKSQLVDIRILRYKNDY